MGNGFYTSEDPTNSIKVLKEMLQTKTQTMQRTKYTEKYEIVYSLQRKDTKHNYNTTSPLVYSNMGWLGDSSHRGQGWQAWDGGGTDAAVPPGLPLNPMYNSLHPCTWLVARQLVTIVSQWFTCHVVRRSVTAHVKITFTVSHSVSSVYDHNMPSSVNIQVFLTYQIFTIKFQTMSDKRSSGAVKLIGSFDIFTEQLADYAPCPRWRHRWV